MINHTVNCKYKDVVRRLKEKISFENVMIFDLSENTTE